MRYVQLRDPIAALDALVAEGWIAEHASGEDAP
jgi:hypothetical protein